MLNLLLFCVNINYILGASPETGVGRLISQEKESLRRLQTVTDGEQCSFPVLSIEHNDNPTGMFFNLGYGTVRTFLNVPIVDRVIFEVFNSRTKEIRSVILWNHVGRIYPYSAAKAGDFEIGDELTFQGDQFKDGCMIQDTFDVLPYILEGISETNKYSIQSVGTGKYLDGESFLEDQSEDYWTIEQTNIGYAIKSVSSNMYLASAVEAPEISGDSLLTLVEGAVPSDDYIVLNWQFIQTKDGYMAIKSTGILSNEFLRLRITEEVELGLIAEDPLDVNDPYLQWNIEKYIPWEDGTLCDEGTTCDYCKNDATYWTNKAHKACGAECWPDGEICGAGTTCNKCCNTARDALGTKCGGSKWKDGTLCGLGTTCNFCQNKASWWWSKFAVACGSD